MSIFRLFAAAVAAAAALAAAAVPGNAARVQLDADLGQSVLHAGSTDHVYLRLSLKSPAVRRDRERPPINVAIVIDRSGSMEGDRIRAAQEAARVALERLSSDDIVSLVAYNHNITVLHRAARLAGSQESLERAIESLEANGTTALYAGVEEGGAQVREFLSDNNVNRVILLSDGLANVGPSQPYELAELGRELASEGITVTTIGLGLDYNEDLMQRLAASSDGNHAFVERASDLAEIFDKEFGDAISVAASDITIIIECHTGFRPMRILGRDGDISGQRITLKMNQLQAENERYVIVELETAKGAGAGERDIADIRVDYLDLDTKARAKAERNVKARLSVDKPEAEASLNKSVMSQVATQIATERNEEAVELRDKGDISAARKLLEDNAAYLDRQKVILGSGVNAAPAPAVEGLIDLATKNREAAKSLDADDWAKTRKSMRYDQHRSKMQQSY